MPDYQMLCLCREQRHMHAYDPPFLDKLHALVLPIYRSPFSKPKFQILLLSKNPCNRSVFCSITFDLFDRSEIGL